MKYYIAVAGNIGVGKSSLTELLSERLGWEPFYEAVAENPYLSDFYQDMRRWSFHSQVFFLSRRLHHHYDLLNRPGSVIQDRSVYEDAEIFARNLYNGGNMSEADWRTYYDLYELATTIVRPPNLVVYLQASVPTLLGRITLRGRDFERSIQPEYIARLNELYEDWTARFNLCPVLTINTDGMDFVHNPEHMELIARRIWDRLQGKETITFHSS
jgi:deoxyadenosine/deoxycytidine kinase